MEFIKEPHIQLGIYLSVLFLSMIISKLNSEIVITHGVNTLLIWILISTLAGISTEYSWWYYFYLVGSLLLGYLSLWACFYISDKFGEPYMGEGGLYLLAPIMITVFLLTVSLVIKFIWHFFVLPT